MKQRVLLLSTVHTAADSRIVYKILPSLAGRYEVFAALQDASFPAAAQVRLIRLPVITRLWMRLLISFPVVLVRCLPLKPAILHFFSPELIPLAFVFRALGTRVVYEVQENLYKKFALKRYNNAWLFRLFFRWFDHAARKHFHLVFTEDAYLQEYTSLKYPPTLLHNYVSLDFVRSLDLPERRGVQKSLLYSGVISLERAFDTLMKALAIVHTRTNAFDIHFFGPLRVYPKARATVPGALQEHVHFHGTVSLPAVFIKGVDCMAGIALLKPVGDYPDSYPTKLFEYMAMGLPVVTSDFIRYKQIVETNQCGFCVCPYNEHAVSEALLWLLQHPEDARAMGANGRAAVARRYNWQAEEPALWKLYQEVSAGRENYL